MLYISKSVWVLGPTNAVQNLHFSHVLQDVDAKMTRNYVKMRRLDGNIESKPSNNTYLNIIEIFNELFKKINIIESRNLVVTSTSKKGNFKCIRKFTSVT